MILYNVAIFITGKSAMSYEIDLDFGRIFGAINDIKNAPCDHDDIGIALILDALDVYKPDKDHFDKCPACEGLYFETFNHLCRLGVTIHSQMEDQDVACKLNLGQFKDLFEKEENND